MNHEKKRGIGLKFKVQFVVLVGICAVFTAVFYSASKNISDIDAEKARIAKEIEVYKADIAELERELTLRQTDAYYEKIAREELGLVKENEIIFRTR